MTQLFLNEVTLCQKSMKSYHRFKIFRRASSKQSVLKIKTKKSNVIKRPSLVLHRIGGQLS